MAKQSALKVPTGLSPEKQAKVDAILKKYEEQNRQIEREHAKEMAKLYGGAALQIGSAFIPGTLGLKLAGGAIKGLAPIVGRKIAQNVATGVTSGLASGAVEGLGRGLMENQNPLKTMATDSLAGGLLGGLGGYGLGKVAQKFERAKLPNNTVAQEQYFNDYVADLNNKTKAMADFRAGKLGMKNGKMEKAYNFIGENAQNIDKSALEKAKEMFAQNLSNEDIRQNTGWFKGVDDKWRYEIPSGEVKLKDFFYNKYDDMIKQDYEMVDLFRERGWDNKIDDYLKTAEENKVILDKINNNFNEDIVKNYGNFNTKLPNIYKNDDLYSAYPELSNTNIRFSNEERPSTIAYFDPSERGKNGIIINTDFKDFSLDNLKRDLAHEIQHYIQDKENFAKGGQYNGNWEEYFNLAGEAEARLAGNRVNLTPKEILETKLMYDVKPENQIVRFDYR